MPCVGLGATSQLAGAVGDLPAGREEAQPGGRASAEHRGAHPASLWCARANSATKARIALNVKYVY
jgi:hypothetical protein